jgi:hypothetical protein
MKQIFITLHLITISLIGALQAQSKSIIICDFNSKEPQIGVNLYSFKKDTCYNSDFNGLINFDLISEDKFQVEYTGYRLLEIDYKQMKSVDTLFLKEIGNVDLGSTGIEPFIESDKYSSNCKCCKRQK